MEDFVHVTSYLMAFMCVSTDFFVVFSGMQKMILATKKVSFCFSTEAGIVLIVAVLSSKTSIENNSL